MIPADQLLTFALAAALLSLAPGPDILFVMTQSALYGARKGIATTAGLCTGLIFHTAAVALGVAVIFKTSDIAFTLLKTAGAVYLLYLAWQAWRASLHTANDSATNHNSTKGNGITTYDPAAENNAANALPRARPHTGFALYRRGIVMNISNPKVSLFFLAFLPQFTSPEYGNVMLQTAMLGAVFMLVGFTLFCVIAWSAASLSQRLLSSPRAQVLLNRITAGVFTSMAVKLMLSTADD